MTVEADNAALQRQIAALTAVTSSLARSLIDLDAQIKANAHVSAVLLSFLGDAGIVDPLSLANRVELTLQWLPEGPAKSHVESIVRTLRTFDPTAGKPVFSVIQGGLLDTPTIETD